jgi:dTDP-4-dehydrorhamnose reductase
MRLLVTGASGQLGGYLLREIEKRGWPVIAWSGSRTGRLFGVDLQPVDLANPGQVQAAFSSAAPTTVIHAGAIAAMAECRRDPERARQINTQATALLAELARERETRFLFVSTDLVFDGEKGWYREQDRPSPLSVYAHTKAAAEPAVLAIPRGVVVRVSLLFGPNLVGQSSFFDEQVRALREARPLTLFNDEWRTPLGFATAARAILEIAQADVTGILHLGGPERMSRLEMGQRLAAYLGVNDSTMVSVPRSGVPSPEPRPRDTSLDCSYWRALFPSLPWPSWQEALTEMG